MPMARRLRGSKGATLVAMAAVVAVASGARADEVSLHALVEGSLGATNNAYSVEDPVEGAADNRTTDFQYQLIPGILMAYATPRTTHEIDTSLELTGYMREAGNTLGIEVRGGYRGVYLLTPRTDASLSAQLASGSPGTLNVSAPASETTGEVRPSGNLTVFRARGDQSLHYVATPSLQLGQGLGVGYTRTADDLDRGIRTLEGSASLSLDRSFRVSSIGIEVAGTVVEFDRDLPTMSPILEADRRADARATLRYRRDLNARWAMGLDAGAVAVIPLDDLAERTIVPIAAASLGYAPAWGSALLQARRDVVANPYLGQQTVTEGVTLNLDLPLPWIERRTGAEPPWSASGSLAVARSRFVNIATSELDGSFLSELVDVALSYAFDENWSLSLRLQFFRQDTLTAPSSEVMAAPPDYSRGMALFSFTYRYPARQAAEISDEPALRVDSSSDPTPEASFERTQRQ